MALMAEDWRLVRGVMCRDRDKEKRRRKKTARERGWCRSFRTGVNLLGVHMMFDTEGIETRDHHHHSQSRFKVRYALDGYGRYRHIEP